MPPPTGKDDEDGGGHGAFGSGAPAGIGSFAPPPVHKPKKKATVKDKILAVVTHEMTAKEIRDQVDAAAGTIRNNLGDLVADGKLRQVDHGVYVPVGSAVRCNRCHLAVSR
ncbi:hypothetical protein [Streptomyces cavernae]|uniref:hypothetical protein n=1 Tax=Streptomyces cavernae TaxID=2259034 RepID=UPI000FEC118E|nr:hypothetical protein [Streptomyces cavernae]